MNHRILENKMKQKTDIFIIFSPLGCHLSPCGLGEAEGGPYSSASDIWPKPLVRMFGSGMGTCPNPGKPEPKLEMSAQIVALLPSQLLK